MVKPAKKVIYSTMSTADGEAGSGPLSWFGLLYLRHLALSISEDMSRFPSLEDQLDLITKGAAEIVALEAGVPNSAGTLNTITLANLSIFHNVVIMSKEPERLITEVYAVDVDLILAQIHT